MNLESDLDYCLKCELTYGSHSSKPSYLKLLHFEKEFVAVVQSIIKARQVKQITCHQLYDTYNRKEEGLIDYENDIQNKRVRQHEWTYHYDAHYSELQILSLVSINLLFKEHYQRCLASKERCQHAENGDCGPCVVISF